jgi:ketosteroid isomerase-like protein
VTEIGNVELLRLGFESFQREGPSALTALLALADPEIELYGGPGTEPSGLYRGHEEAVRWSEEWFEAWEEFQMEPTEFIEVTDEIVVVPLHQVARGKSSGVEVEVDTAFLFEIREGRVTRLHVYADADQALSAAERLATEG